MPIYKITPSLAPEIIDATIGEITKTDIDLGNVDNTSDIEKPISTATQTALNLKAPLASPTFTGTPTGITKAHVGLSLVDNTSDLAKPISTLTQTALDLKAPLNSPVFLGLPAAPTADLSTNSTVLATTAFVQGKINQLISGAPGLLDTFDEIAAALGDDPNLATTLTNALTLKAPLASPTFTGTVSGVTKAHVGLGSVDNTSDLAKPISTATQTALDLKLASSSYTAADVLTKIKTVDGPGSDLDADLLDGLNGAAYAVKAASNTFVGTQTIQAPSTSAMLKLERTATSAGSGWIGADDGYAFNVYDSGLNRRFSVTQTGHLHIPNLPVFAAYNCQAGVTANYLVFALTTVNNGSHYNTSNGRFTAPVAGTYKFSTHVFVDRAASTNAYGVIYWYKNGVGIGPVVHSEYISTSQYETLAMSYIIPMSAGDYVQVYMTGTGGGASYGGQYNSFTGYLLTTT